MRHGERARGRLDRPVPARGEPHPRRGRLRQARLDAARRRDRARRCATRRADCSRTRPRSSVRCASRRPWRSRTRRPGSRARRRAAAPRIWPSPAAVPLPRSCCSPAASWRAVAAATRAESMGPAPLLATVEGAMATVQRTLQRSELRILAILGVPTFALALGDHDGLDLPARPGRGLLGFLDRHRPADRRRGAHRAVAAARGRLVVGSAAHAAGQPAALHPRRHPGARRRAGRARLRRLDRGGRGRRRGLLRRLLRRLRAVPRALPGPRRRRDRRARAEQPGDLPRPRDLPGAGRRRSAHLDLRARCPSSPPRSSSG